MNRDTVTNNVERFSGFEDCYDNSRPQTPQIVIDILMNYLGNNPDLVVDLGSGTGLSSFVWKNHAKRIIGIEPNDDMRGKAMSRLSHSEDAAQISFVQGYSHDLKMEPSTVDIITCSQSFHWMEPVSTLQEAHRVLRKGGIFAAYDCDWPPTLSWALESQYKNLTDKADLVVAASVDKNLRETKWSKEQHLHNIESSGKFRFAKEIVFHNWESCDAERCIGLAVSQGGMQLALKQNSAELAEEIERYRDCVEKYFAGGTRQILFSYRMRLGIK